MDKVDFFYKGVLIATDKSASGDIYSIHYNVQGAPVEVVLLSAIAYDMAGNASVQVFATFTVIADTAPPFARIVSDISTMTLIEGQTVNIIVEATDDVKVDNVKLRVNGVVTAQVSLPVSNTFYLPYMVENLIPAGSASITVLLTYQWQVQLLPVA